MLRENAKDSAAFLQPLVRAVRAHHKWRIVPGVSVTQASGGAVQLSVEKCDEAVGMRVPPNQRVQTIAEVLRRQGWGTQTADSRLQIGHQQRRRDAFSGHVRDAQAQGIGPQREKVEIIAPHRARRLPGTGDFISCQLGDVARKKPFLDGLGFGDLAFLLLKMMQGFFPGVLLLIGPPARFTAFPAHLDLLFQDLQQP